MKQLETNLIFNQGNKLDLIKDLESICRIDDLLMETYDTIYGQQADNIGNAIMKKYEISQKELQANFIFYRAYEVRN